MRPGSARSSGVRGRVAAAWAAAGLLSYLGSLALRSAPGASEFYARSVGPVLSRPLSLLTGLFPLSVAELVLLGYASWLGTRGVRALRAPRRSGAADTPTPVPSSARRALFTATAGLRRVIRDLGVFLVAFYLLWGFNYARRPFEERAGWPTFEGAEAAELQALASESIDVANRAYREIHGSDDAGAPTQAVRSSPELNRALQEGWSRAAAVLDLGPHVSRSWGRAKRPFASALLARFGIAGMYVPLTAEPHVLRGYPTVRALHSVTHEQAHQRGFAIEAEASFVGFVVAAHAPATEARYSAAVYAATRFLGSLGRVDPDQARAQSARLLPGIQRDLADVSAFWERYRWAGTGIGRAVNDRYLRAHRVPGGVGSYARADRLLIAFARQRGGALFSE